MGDPVSAGAVPDLPLRPVGPFTDDRLPVAPCDACSHVRQRALSGLRPPARPRGQNTTARPFRLVTADGHGDAPPRGETRQGPPHSSGHSTPSARGRSRMTASRSREMSAPRRTTAEDPTVLGTVTRTSIPSSRESPGFA
ncbi:hypothetical protein SUDANB121_01875 [Nocardiopsis dassonvillei]